MTEAVETLRSVTRIGTNVQFFDVMFFIFLTLRLTNVIDWSYWWVTAPIWIPFAVVVAFALIIGFYKAFRDM